MAAAVAWLQRVSVARPAERRFLSPLACLFGRSLALSVSPLFTAVFLRIRIARMETKPVITCLKTLLIVYSFVFWVGNLAMILRGLHLRIYIYIYIFGCNILLVFAAHLNPRARATVCACCFIFFPSSRGDEGVNGRCKQQQQQHRSSVVVLEPIHIVNGRRGSAGCVQCCGAQMEGGGSPAAICLFLMCEAMFVLFFNPYFVGRHFRMRVERSITGC